MANIMKNHEFIVRNRLLLWVMLAFLALTGCQGQGVYRAYHGEPRPADVVARFVVPTRFNLLYLDDKEYKASALSDGARLELLPGKHQLVIEYDEFWDLTNENHERVTSQPVMMSFKLKPGRQYILKAARQIKGVEQARAFARKPEMEIIDQASGQSLAVAFKYRVAEQKYLAGFTTKDSAAGKKTEAPKMLQHWWNQADDKQQQNFLNWAKSHRKNAQ